MKKIKVLAILVPFSLPVLSQDMVTMRSGAVYEARILAVTDSAVQFKMHNNPDGPLYNISQSLIASITYQNGSTEKLISTDASNQQAVTINGYNTVSSSADPGPTDFPTTPEPSVQPRPSQGNGLGLILGIGFIALKLMADKQARDCRDHSAQHTHTLHCSGR
jgi:hypothetical protein